MHVLIKNRAYMLMICRRDDVDNTRLANWMMVWFALLFLYIYSIYVIITKGLARVRVILGVSNGQC